MFDIITAYCTNEKADMETRNHNYGVKTVVQDS